MVRKLNDRARIHPQLEKLEERCQPGSLPTDFTGWSFLGQSFAELRLDNDDASAPAMLRSESTTSPRHAVGPTVVMGRDQADAPCATTPAPTEPAEADGLLAAASVQAVPLNGDGGSIAKIDGTWYALADMPSRRQEVATAVLDGDIYVLGGFNPNGQPTNTVEVYSPKTDSWRRAAPLPLTNDHGGAATAAGVLFAFGGRSNRVFAYDPAKDAWSEVASMRFPHGGTPAVAVIDDYLYVAGGNGAGMVGNETEVYDPYNDVWYDLAPMNIPRNHTAGGAVDGLFYVAAGRGTNQSATAFEVYDPKSDSWGLMPELPTGRSGVAAGVVNGCLYVFGGEMPGVFSEVEVYDVYAGEWRPTTSMPTPRHGIFASVIDNAIYIPGGAIQQGFGATNVHEVLYIE